MNFHEFMHFKVGQVVNYIVLTYGLVQLGRLNTNGKCKSTAMTTVATEKKTMMMMMMMPLMVDNQNIKTYRSRAHGW